ncbi:uncharacterized protein LOC126859385 [Cataglyphis hispanica]|uniref:uncharacterized protein LOC126859385 n=1 Tax=Cataglyphis hispanica TaxID=1086592 RepID=UPI00217FAD63|nr:uncharacterized protein LOC126859385 [Cataglyphis hispanica]XP_050466620.1 uncharacterized protein LOC126859385 [Cataglyphis hispanica]XP_050466621.1 uncharacterized protein LOC126859385 [Cataglyphis hispanica]XP_050466622.1 uncharacterized protein LOC126859385 [Cataglyphis hispanica]
MENEDFGFARRSDNVLRMIHTVSNEQMHDNNTIRNDEQRICSSSKTSEVGGGGSTTSAPPIRAGSEGRERASTAAGSVVPDTPNIPNVVEYHLKVKPRSTTRHCRHDNIPRDQSLEEMKKEKIPVSFDDKKKDFVSKLSRLSIDNNVFEGSTDLPQVFQVKYLGSHDARGLWGIKHTRRPVDNMVSAAKALPTNTMLPLIKLVVSQEGVTLLPIDKRKQDANSRMYPIETISYGVQDLIYTRVFSMIVVRETENFRRISPFECHGFVCESKYYARQLTYALATAFEMYSKTVKAQEKLAEVTGNNTARKRFAIDLRSPEEIEADLTMDSEA